MPGVAFFRVWTPSRRGPSGNRSALPAKAPLVASPVLQRAHVQSLVVLACAHIDIAAAHRDSVTSVRVLPALSIGGAPRQAARQTAVLLGKDIRAALAAHRAANN